MTTSISGNTISSPHCTSHVAQGSYCSHWPLGWEDVTDHPWRVEHPLSSIQWIGAWPLSDFPCRTQRPSNFQGLRVKLCSANTKAVVACTQMGMLSSCWRSYDYRKHHISGKWNSSLCVWSRYDHCHYLWGNRGLVKSDIWKNRNIWP